MIYVIFSSFKPQIHVVTILTLLPVIHNPVFVTWLIWLNLPFGSIQNGNPNNIQIWRVTLTTNPQYLRILEVTDNNIHKSRKHCTVSLNTAQTHSHSTCNNGAISFLPQHDVQVSVTKWKVHFRAQQHKADRVCGKGEGHLTSPPLAPFAPSARPKQLDAT
jgi:hypothetical protein